MTVVMVASVAFVVTFEIPSSTSDAPRVALAQRVRDVLAILNDTPVQGSNFGNDELGVSLLDCLQNRCERLRTDLDDLMPDGSRYGIYLSTPEGLYPILAPWEPGGEAVSASRLIEPAWSYQFMATSQSIYNPYEDPLVVYGLPVYSANPVHQGGSPLGILVSANRTDDGSVYFMKGSATTRAVAPTDVPSAAAVSTFFHAGDGVALASRDVRSQTINGSLLPTESPVSFWVRIAETGGGVVPAGSYMAVHMPQGWTAQASQPANAADWTIMANATDPNGTAGGSSVVAKLNHSVTNGYVDLVFDAVYMGDSNDHYPFVAQLYAGAYAQAATLVRADTHSTKSAFEIPSVLVSVPRPLGAPATTTWTLSAYSPDPLEVTRIEFVEEEGRNIFASVAGLTGGGTWSTNGSRIVWTGAAEVGWDSPLNLTFSVTSTGVRGPSTERAPFFPSVDLGNYTGPLKEQTSPGLHRGVFLPASATYQGYDGSITSGVTSNHSLDSASVYRTTALPGVLNYTVGAVAGLKDSVFGSAVSVERRYYTPGETVNISVEVQSVIYQLGQLGLEPSIDLHVYPPWAGDDRSTLASKALYNGTLSKGGGSFLDLIDANGNLVIDDQTELGRLDTSVEIPANWLYGPYVVEAEVTWLEQVSAPPVTQTLVRTAHVYDYFVVRPTSGDLPSSPVYNVQLLAWYEDWG